MRSRNVHRGVAHVPYMNFSRDPTTLQVHLASEIANFLQWFGMWDELREFLDHGLSQVENRGCAGRGLHCDSDLIAYAWMMLRYHDGACDDVLHTLETWPFVSMRLDSWVNVSYVTPVSLFCT